MKNSYREFFAWCGQFLKMKYFLKIAGINQVTFSRFMKSSDFDYCISEKRLEELKNVIISEVGKIA